MTETLQVPEKEPAAEARVPAEAAPLSESELRARRTLIIGAIILAVVFVAVVTLLVLLSIHAYQTTMAGAGPDAGAVVMGLLRDAAIIMVAFETLLIGLLVLVLALQVQALVRLLRDEIQPMLEAINETVSTVRGTTQFMSETIVSPTIRAAGLLSGARRVAREVLDLGKIAFRPKSSR
ncbi:MAG: hypothetical protein JW900_11570 [Anaerolineae bacterium]|nr:hypothetical protein [Anaerolineae bacterium]